MKKIDINTKLISSLASDLKKTEEVSVKKISDKTKEFVSRISNSSPKVIEEFLQNNAKKIPIRNKNANLYMYKNILLCRSNKSLSYDLEQNLNNNANLSSLPVFVEYFELGKDDFLTIMDVSTEKLIPYFKVAEKVPKETKIKFKNEQKQLLKDGLINKEIFANKNALFVTNDGKTIVHADWGSLSYLTTEETRYFAEYINNWKF